MKDLSSMWQPTMCADLSNATGLPVLQDGHTPCASPDGLTIGQSGPDLPLASHSVPPGNRKAVTMQDTSPPSLSAWSGLPAPECCLANRSQARKCSERLQSALEETLSRRLNGLGSMIYQTGWKPHVTPLGRAISRQRASAPRTSGSAPSSEPSAMSGWPTATARDGFPAHSEEYIAAKKAQGHGMANLNDLVMLAGWTTASASDGSRAGTGITEGMTGSSLTQQAQVAGWPTTQASDGSGGGQAKRALNPARSNDLMDFAMLAKDCPARLTASGQMLTGSCAGMESGGQLNPDLSRWLMGYPVAWGSCGASAMQLIRTRRQSSSKRSAKASILPISGSVSRMEMIFRALLPMSCETGQ